MKITDKILKEIRLEYGSRQLTRNDLKKEPIETFQDWFNDALISKVKEPNAMVLATSENNSPKARYVLFKGIIDEVYLWGGRALSEDEIQQLADGERPTNVVMSVDRTDKLSTIWAKIKK